MARAEADQPRVPASVHDRVPSSRSDTCGALPLYRSRGRPSSNRYEGERGFETERKTALDHDSLCPRSGAHPPLAKKKESLAETSSSADQTAREQLFHTTDCAGSRGKKMCQRAIED
ncbi:hypothetical protein KM043_008749 [Ampulex compressa]|nr:hypothetical protein KM043_008749 [Ampulex compressa]